MAQEDVINIFDEIKAIKTLRDDVPEFNPNDPDSKEKIDAFHQAVHSKVMAIKIELGFEDYEQALKFIDKEIENLGRRASQL